MVTLKKISLSIIAIAISSFSMAQEAVEWETLNNSQLQGTKVVSTISTAWQAFGKSVQKIAAGKDGYVEFTIERFGMFLGLTSKSSVTGYSDIDYSMQIWSSSNVYAGYNGTQQGYKTKWAVGDVIRIEKKDKIISMTKNGVFVYFAILWYLIMNCHECRGGVSLKVAVFFPLV